MNNQLNFSSLGLENTYSSLKTDLVEEVIVPLLERSVEYDRGVGFFTSGWLKEAAKGLTALVHHQGKARILLLLSYLKMIGKLSNHLLKMIKKIWL